MLNELSWKEEKEVIVQFTEARCRPDMELNTFHLPAFHPQSLHFCLCFLPMKKLRPEELKTEFHRWWKMWAALYRLTEACP